MVRDDETPAKHVTVNIADDASGGRKALTYGLYGHWQTESFARPALTAEGLIPVSTFGNFDVPNGDALFLPDGCVLLTEGGVKEAAAALGMQAVPAVVGWVSRGGGQQLPTIGGAVVLATNADIIRQVAFTIDFDREASANVRKSRCDLLIIHSSLTCSRILFHSPAY